MLKTESFKFLLHALKNSDIKTQNILLKDIKSKLNLLTSQELKLLLAFLNNIRDIELEIKLFSLLSLCLAIDDTHYETIARNDLIYKKLEVILNKGLPSKTTNVLNFLTALVYNEDGSECSFSVRSNVAAHARSMVRTSGCLNALSTLFINSMMFPDSWKALCQCLAECCRDCLPNKVHCAHLIPLCVQKCLQGFTDVLLVLQAIISNHPKNLQIFLSCNGEKIFTSEYLQYEVCLQILSTVVQSCIDVAKKIRGTDISRQVTEILHWNGPHSRKGQWCTIILYYLNSGNKTRQAEPIALSCYFYIKSEQHNYCDVDTRNVKFTDSTSDKVNKTIMKNDSKEDSINDRQPKINGNKKNDEYKNNDNDNYIDHLQRNNSTADDTTNLFQNVVKEILFWKSKDEANHRIKPFINACMGPLIQTNTNNEATASKTTTMIHKKNVPFCLVNKEDPLKHEMILKNDTGSSKELSFSFLKEEQITQPQKYMFRIQEEDSQITSNRKRPIEKDAQSKIFIEKEIQTNFQDTKPPTFPANFFDDYDDKSILDSKTFKPTIMSTPKQKRVNKPIIHTTRKKQKDKIKKAHSYLYTKQREREHKKIMQRQKQSSPVKKLTSRSMSARFMDVINESCTTLVKTVKDVFMPWKNTTLKNSSKDENVKTKVSKPTHTYSFVNYMRERDAILSNSKNYCSFDVNEEFPCKTCNDTTILKQKLENNTELCKTIKKLKLGINLYGCNFKKISKTFWPQDAYMTPTVLYGLYRKLILK